MTPAQKRDIFYRAAAYIEAHPDRYDFANVVVPERGDDGCMWGHALRMAGAEAGEKVAIAVSIFGAHKTKCLFNFQYGQHVGFTNCPRAAARLMRAFADHHWPAPEKPIAMRFPELMRSLGAREEV